MLHAPDILARSLSVPQPRGKDGELWQYHSRSDLREHVKDGKVVVRVSSTPVTASSIGCLVDPRRIELLTSALQRRRSTN